MSVDKSLTFEHRDEYNRKPIAEKVINLLISEVEVSPLIIDGGWGTGKSEFCHKLINLLESNEKNKLQSVYIDAFKADHADEPLMTLLAAVLKLLPDEEAQQTLIKKALPALRFGAKTAFKAGVSWVLKQDATDIVDDYEGDLKKAGDKIVNKTIESILVDHVKSDESIEALKDALIELTKEKPIVIFVDDLDRCRPDFAMSMLESIKHIFDVEGVQFVLVVNKNQLKATINHCYGSEVNARRYLDKFIGYSFPISKIININVDNKRFAPQEHYAQLVNDSSVLNKSGLKSSEILKFAKNLISLNGLSLREVETFLKYLETYHVLSKNGLHKKLSNGVFYLRVLGVFIHCFNPELIKDRNDSDVRPIISLLGADGMPNIEGDLYPINLLAAMLFMEQFTVGGDTERKWLKEIKKQIKGTVVTSNKMAQIMRVTDILCLRGD